MIKINSLKRELICLIFAVTFIICYLVCKEPRESLCLILSFYFIFKILNKESNIYIGTNKKKAIMLKLVVIVVTYVLIQMILLFNTDKKDLDIEKSYINKEEKAILLVYEGEAEKYNLKNQTRNINIYGSMLEKTNISFILNKSKRNYYEIGKSDYRKKATRVKEKLEKSVQKEKYKLYLSFLKDNVYIDETITEIVNSGYSEVILIPMFIKKDIFYDEIERTIDNMKLFNEEIIIKHTESFGDSKKLVNLYMKKINDQLNQDKISSTGVILVGSGENPTEEEILFRSNIKDYLCKFSHIEENKIKKAWFSKNGPDYVDEIKDVLELGVSDIIIIYTELGVTNIENNEIRKRIIKEIKFPEDIKIKIIDGFLIEDDFIEEIKKRIELLDIME